MNQDGETKSDSDNESSSGGSKNNSSDSDSESGSESSNSSSSGSSSHGSKSNKSSSLVNNESLSNPNNQSKASSDHEQDNDDETTTTRADHENGLVQEQPGGGDNGHSDEEDEDDDDDDAASKSDEDASVKNHSEDDNSEEDYHTGRSSYDEEDIPKNNQRARKIQIAKNKRGFNFNQTRTQKKNNYKNNWNSGTSEEEDGSASQQNSDSDEDASPPVKQKAPVRSRSTRAKKPKATKRSAKYTSDEESDSDDDNKRFASRRAAATSVSYKEASEDDKTDSEDLLEVEYEEPVIDETDKSETIEKIVAMRIGRKGITGGQTTMYAVEENGDPNEGCDEADTENVEVQYSIKWKGWSHIHNTWESESSLKEQKVKGIKKLENYIKREQDISNWRRYAGPEDIDYYECQLELHQDLLKSYNNIDRIIAQVMKPEGGGVDYYCKWESLPYADATWEDAGLVSRKWSQKIKSFEDREDSKFTPSKHCKVLKYRPKFHRIKEQPEFLGNAETGLCLRDYQMDGLNWLYNTWCKDNSVILADEMGLGKTIQTICFLYNLFKTHSLFGPYLCVVPLSTMTAWQREFELWAPEMNIVTYLGDVQSREIIRQYEWCFENSKRLKFNAILTTYEILLKDKAFLGCIPWASLLVDEAHRLKNDDSLLYKALKEFDTNHRLLITGTPLQNSLKELWALLHFIMPQKFETWEDFEKDHGNAADKGYTKLHKQLEPFILRRVKKDVEKSLPAKVEQILRVEMTSIQKQYYKWILTKNFNALRKGVKGSTSTFLNIVIELKKCCNHAALIRPAEYESQSNTEDVVQHLLRGSGKLVLLDKLLVRLRETGHRVLIFSQMVRMLDILAEYLQKRHFPFQRLDGSIKGEIRKQALDHFNAEGSPDFCFLLSTRAGGLGINLATADTVIIFDSDWNPQNDLQAQARAHRIGQKNQVNIYRLVTARSVEEDIVERAKQKMVLDHLVIQRMDTTGRTVLDKSSTSNTTPFNKEDLSAILKFGAEELFKDEPEGDGDDLVCDIDEILRRAETRDEAPAMAGDELLSAFKVASFGNFEEEKPLDRMSSNLDGDQDMDTKEWDEIIPENMRKAIEEQAKNKEMEDLYLPPRRKTLQQINQANDVGEDSKGRKRKKTTEDDESDEGSDGSGDDRPRKRGRPPVREKITNFTDAELRRFIKSYKKFPAPLKRLEAIACDAELQEKPLAELKKIAEMLRERCVTFLDEHSKENENDAASTAKKRGARAGFSVKFGGVSFNAKTLMQSQEELQPLDEIMPATPEDRTKWVLDIKTRPANFDIDWAAEEDSKLLVGIYQYGVGSWDAIKMDPSLNLAEKILQSDENKKPQTKHLQSRSEYLLKIIRKNVELKKGVQKQKRPRKQKEKPVISKESIEHEEISSGGDEAHKRQKREIKATGVAAGTAMESENKALNNHDENSLNKDLTGSSKKPKKEKNKEPKKNKKKQEGPMHFTANNEPRALDVLGDLDPSVFNECKEKMRPVKKALKALDNPDQSLSAQEQINHTRACLLSIGKQIDICLTVFKEADKIKEWKSNLWYFVSKFTEFDAKKLFKLYKHALKRSEETKHSATKDKPSTATKVSSNAEHKHHNNKETKSHAVTAVSDKKVRKEKRKNAAKAKGAAAITADVLNRSSELNSTTTGDSLKDEQAKRRLEDSGEYEGDSKTNKRLHKENRSREKDERKKWDDYNNPHSSSSVGGDRIPRTSSGPPRGATPTTPSRMPTVYPQDGRPDGRTASGTAYGDPRDPWCSSRDRFSDHRKERYDNYNRLPPSSYHRERDHRDRDRDRDRRIDKRRYAPPVGYPPKGHYMPPASASYYGPGVDIHATGYRERYAPPPGSSLEWNRSDREYDYRRDYDRRPPPPANS